MTNPFEDENGIYHVLINEEGQHSLWPSFIEVPAGWTIIHQSDSRAGCLKYVETHWTDMRPKSLIARMQEMKESSGHEQQKDDEITGADESKRESQGGDASTDTNGPSPDAA